MNQTDSVGCTVMLMDVYRVKDPRKRPESVYVWMVMEEPGGMKVRVLVNYCSNQTNLRE